ncbi:hypothetical protein PIB30_063677 [Stylosanthes scabra]|uniref:Uncharacterized protein n=1 Tax=Stylosanthes scabra TaxID=79078 RepID=A0ABU6TMW2_9FABA|nr:hypothetical protein [Stylosanthes scabra]
MNGYNLLDKLAEIDLDSEDEYEDAEEEEVTGEDEEEVATESAKDTTDKEVRKIYVPDCLCDPRACANVMPLELYKVLDLGLLKKTTDTFHLADTKPPKSNNGTNPQVLLGRPFLKTTGFKLNFYDETFSLEVGNVIEIFQPTWPPISQEESEGESVVATEPKETAKRAVTSKIKKDKKNPTPTRKSKQKKEDTKAVKKKKLEK